MLQITRNYFGTNLPSFSEFIFQFRTWNDPRTDCSANVLRFKFTLRVMPRPVGSAFIARNDRISSLRTNASLYSILCTSLDSKVVIKSPVAYRGSRRAIASVVFFSFDPQPTILSPCESTPNTLKTRIKCQFHYKTGHMDTCRVQERGSRNSTRAFLTSVTSRGVVPLRHLRHLLPPRQYDDSG